jgi:glycosyltransferase involved in cell wall biosynthesis
MFTIVIPLFNKEKYIRRAVDSVLLQVFEEFEIIIVDDGSTDNSISKIADISDIRLKIISQANKGVGAARNTGISNASFSWIALLDADDVWTINHLNELKNIIEDFPSSGMVATQIVSIDTNSKIHHISVESEGTIRSIDYFFEASKDSSIVSSSSVAIRKDVFRSIGGFRDYKTGEDLEYWARIALDYPVAISEKVTSYYCRGTGGTTDSHVFKATKKNKSLGETSAAIKLLVDRAQSDPSILKNSNIKSYINNKILSIVKSWLYNGNIPIAKNRAKFALPQRSITFSTLFFIAVTPEFILERVTKAYKNLSQIV